MLPTLRRSALPVLLVTASNLCAAQAPLALEPGDSICLLGNALAERMQHHGWLEVALQARFPEHELSVRNLGFGADELTVHQRTMNFGKFASDGMAMTLANERFVPWDRYLEHCDADVVFAFFGFNESFAGAAGVKSFKADLWAFIEHVQAQTYNGTSAPRLVLFGSIAHEDLGDPALPDGVENNRRIELYTAAAAEVARAKGVPFVNLYAPMRERYGATDEPLTINGIHLNSAGNRVLAEVIDQSLFEGPRPTAPDEEALRAAILEKNLLWFNRYRATDGYNVYGGRSRMVYKASVTGVEYSNFDVLQREMDHIDALCKSRDAAIQALARGAQPLVDDSHAPPLIDVSTNKLGRGPDGLHVYRDGVAAIDAMKTAPGMQVQLFADEAQFPELANPVQMAWDTRGRLWVACWPTYPHWTPGQPMNDKLVILEDTDGDGHADKSTIFADDLHNPTGFEFWNGGVLLAQAPDIVFLSDTDGDDRYDEKEHLLHGFSSADTHHAANSFVLGPDGAVYFQEGTFHMSQVESVRGPVRNHNGCVWRFHPRTFEVERYIPYNYANPHGHVFDHWGQDFMTDGTGNVNYYALPFSGFVQHPDKHRGYFPFFKQRSRPAGGTEFLSSSHFPEEFRDAYLIANVIGFRGVFQYDVLDDESGFTAQELHPIVESDDPNFRPVDLEVGPDGALYVLDWHNAIIGHLQHHLRDPSRDGRHGRVYRVTCAGRPLLERPRIDGAPLAELLDLLKSPEDRTRYAARIELSGRDTDAVVEAARLWASTLPTDDPAHEHHLLEALWLHQQHDRMDRGLLMRLLGARDARARAAATRVLRYGRRHLPDALTLLAESARDRHPRVRLEAVVAASFFDDARATSVALEALRYPTDRFLDYALSETMRALEPQWKAALRAGEPLAEGNPAGVEFLLSRVSPAELRGLPRVPTVLRALLTRDGVPQSARVEAAAQLAAENGTTQATELLAAVRSVDAGGGGHAAHVLHELSHALLHRLHTEHAHRAALLELAQDGALPGTRALGYAALFAHDGTADLAWDHGAQSREGLVSLLGGVALSTDLRAKAALYERIRPLVYAPPAELMTEPVTRGGGTGLDVSFYEPTPRDARRETFAALTPKETLRTPSVTLDLPPANRSDAYGLVFDGTLYVPRSGEYTFATTSDDGSRLYIGDVCVVDNDGAHGMVRRAGKLQLGAGPHPFLVTYYEQGGGHGLQVTWSGPGLAEQPIPDSALGSRGGGALRAAALRALASVPGHEEQKLGDVARVLGDPGLLGPAMELLRSIPRESLTTDGVRAVLDTLAAHVGGLSTAARTSADVTSALLLGRDLAAVLGDEAEAARAQLAGLAGATILIRTLPHQMLFDVTAFRVEAGQPVSLVFQNNDVMPHNLVLTTTGAIARVGTAAELLSAAEAEARGFVPDLPEVLWHTGLVYPGESERITFQAPDAPGEHPFVCTYPGHWRVMNGTMLVVSELGDASPVTRRTSEEAPAHARAFVRDWTLAELEPLLSDGWEREASVARGRTLFTEAGCIKCHTIQGAGSVGGPELTKIREKFRGRDLLRHVVEPSHEILEGYEFQWFDVGASVPVIGRVVDEDAADLHVVETLLEPDVVTLVSKQDVVERGVTKLSPMPTGLLVTLRSDEILDLLAFLQAADDR